MSAFTKDRTVVPQLYGGFSWCSGICRGTISEEGAVTLAKDFIDYHTKAIEVNQATLKHIEAQRLARAEAERLKLSPEQERLWGLVDKWKNPGASLGISADPEQWVWVLVKEPATTYRAGRRISECPWMGVADPSDFPQEIRKPLLDKLCEVHQKTPGQLADWIEEQRRPKPKFEVLSTDRFLAEFTSLWVVRGNQEAWVVGVGGLDLRPSPVEFHKWHPTFKGSADWLTFDEGIRRMREAGWDVQVKQVEPPAPPKPQWPTVKAGDKVKHESFGTYIVAQIDSHSAALICLESGNRWSAPCDVGKPRDAFSLEKIAGKQWADNRVEHWTKLTT